MLADIMLRKMDLNLKKYESEIERQFPLSYCIFKKHDNYDKDFNEACVSFLRFFQVEIDCYQASTKPKYRNTYTAKITINNPEKLRSLGRKSHTFYYPHKSSLESAMHKALFKGFQITEALVSKKLLPEKTRRSNA
jgi:hypothetical protein